MSSESEKRIMVYVSGATYDNRQKTLRRLYKKYTLGEELEVELKLEPDNKHDKFAVKVLVNGKDVGYIPRKVSKLVSIAIKDKMVKKVELNDIHLDSRLIYGTSVTLAF